MAKMRGTFCESTQLPRRKFDGRSLRWIKRGKNWLLIGCPKGQWRVKAERCKVGTRAHKLLRASTHCKAGESRIRKG